MKQKYIIWEPLLLAMMMVLGILIGKTLFSTTSSRSTPQAELGGFEEVLRYIENKYVDPVDRSHLQEVAIDAILSELDPHSKYISHKELEHIKAEMEGGYQGYGITWYAAADSTLWIKKVEKDSKAEENGLRPGQKLLQIDSLDVEMDEIDLSFLDSLGKSEDKINIQLLDPESGEMTVSLSHSTISLPSVRSAFMLNDSVGFIGLHRFSSKTYQEFMKALESLKAEQMDDLIIDLRGNPGGYLQETVKIISQFIKENTKLLVYTEGRKSRRKEYNSNGRIFHEVDDVIIIIDQESASASEILAGSLQDLDRALVVGRRSFGKGLVQEQYDLLNGGAVRLTTARYYVPSGRLIQKDYAENEDYHYDLHERGLQGEYNIPDSAEVVDSVAFFTSSGRTVYGGGGISPDIFLPSSNPFDYADWPDVLRWTREQAFLYFIENTTSLPSEMEQWEDYFNDQRAQFEDRLENALTEEPLGSLVMNDARKGEMLDVFEDALITYSTNDQGSAEAFLWTKDEDITAALELMEEGEVDSYLGVIHE